MSGEWEINVKVVFTGKVKKPKVGDSYCDYGLSGRTGWICEPITKVTKHHLFAGGRMIKLDDYYAREIINGLRSKAKVKVGK